MPDWIITTALLVLALILGCGLLLLARQRKNERTELRLLAGRRQLLSRELHACFAELEALDEDAIATRRHEAGPNIDRLHVALVERQAHLLNCEDLAHLQQCKIALLATPPTPPDPAIESEDPSADKRPTQRTAQHRRAEERNRSAIEGDLLKKITELQDKTKSKN